MASTALASLSSEWFSFLNSAPSCLESQESTVTLFTGLEWETPCSHPFALNENWLFLSSKRH